MARRHKQYSTAPIICEPEHIVSGSSLREQGTIVKGTVRVVWQVLSATTFLDSISVSTLILLSTSPHKITEKTFTAWAIRDRQSEESYLVIRIRRQHISFHGVHQTAHPVLQSACASRTTTTLLPRHAKSSAKPKSFTQSSSHALVATGIGIKELKSLVAWLISEGVSFSLRLGREIYKLERPRTSARFQSNPSKWTRQAIDSVGRTRPQL